MFWNNIRVHIKEKLHLKKMFTSFKNRDNSILPLAVLYQILNFFKTLKQYH